MVLRGVVAAETTSVRLTKLLLIVPCLRHRVPHHCGDLDPFRRIGQMSADFSNLVEGEHGWVLQGVVSRASFRRAAASGQTVFTVLSLHINNVFAKKRGIAKKLIQSIRALMISQNIDLVAGDFNGAAWRCRSRDNLRTIDEVFSDCALRTPPGLTPLWSPGSIPNNWADVCGFLQFQLIVFRKLFD